jgi:hypothetical protein
MDSVLVFCILISETPKVDGTPNYAKNWDPVSRVRSIERQFFKPVNNTAATVAGNTAPQPAPQATPAPDPLAAATAQPNTATQPNVAQPSVQQPGAAAPGSVPPATF